MNSNKFTQVHVYIIGAVLMIIVGVGMYFALLKPLYDENTQTQASVQGTEATNVTVDGHSFNISQAAAAKTALEAAQKRKEQKTQRLQTLTSKFDLPKPERIDLGDTGSDQEILQKTLANWFNLPRRVVPKMEAFARAQGEKHKVRVTTEFKAPAPAADPKSVPRDIIAWNLGTMTMNGKFTDVMQWARSWNSAPLLVAVDGLKCSIADAKGKVDATATLTVYIFPSGKAATIPGASAGATGGGGGMPGMLPPGGPGMSPPGAPGMSPPGMAPPGAPNAPGPPR